MGKSKQGARWVLAVALVGAACDDEGTTSDPAETESRNYTVITGTGWGCHTCGFKNSPYVGKYPLQDFALGGGSGGFSFAEIEDDTGTRHPATVVDDRIVANTPGGLVQGYGIIGWVLIFKRDAGESRLRIVNYGAYPDWVAGDPIETYALAHEVTENGGEVELVDVCPGIGLDDTNVTLTTGETYDDVTKTITANPDRVSVYCRGHAGAKMKLLGRSPNDNYGSTVDDRQATLKMLTADYCGSGDSYTTAGQPLDWMDAMGLFVPGWSPKIDDVEARWDEKGATCLNEPRNPAYKRSDVTCQLPLCEGDPEDLKGGYWASYHAP